MNPYTKTNFGNTHIMIINAHCLRGAKCNTHIMIINAHYLRGAKCNTCLGP